MSVPKLLFPYHNRIETNFTLEATDGCFIWSSSRPDLVHVDQLLSVTKYGQTCSSKANVISIAKQPIRNSATVYAKDVMTGQTVRCDVIIDKISALEIIYTTTRLYLEDAPELFKIRAHDHVGSTFSSIDHFPFEWKLLTDDHLTATTEQKKHMNVVDATKVIRILRLTDSSYEMSDTIRDLESHGSLSYKILLEGLRTGSALVQAEIIDNDYYRSIQTKSVRISVSANVQLYPSYDLYLLPYSRVQFRLLQIKRNEYKDISTLPSTKQLYDVNVLNTNAGDFNKNTYLFKATDHADETTRVELIDRNMKAIDLDSYEPNYVSIKIVNVGYLSATTNATKTWIFQLGHTYLLTIELFDVNGRRIYSADNLNLQINIPKEQHKTCLTLKSSHKNGTQYEIRPNCVGRFHLEFHLNGIYNERNELIQLTSIATSGEQYFDVYLPLTVTPKHILLPADTTSTNDQSTSSLQACHLTVAGGSGDYIWTSHDANIVSVSAHGNLIEQSGAANQTIVQVFDMKSPELNASAHIELVKPDQMELLTCPVETELSNTLRLPIKMSYKHNQLTCCSRLDFHVQLDDEQLSNGIFEYQGVVSPNNEKYNDDKSACAILLFKSIKSGLTSVRVTLKSYNLEQSLLISSYESLYVNRQRLLLSVDSLFHLKLANGPLIVSDQHKHQQNPQQFDITSADNEQPVDEAHLKIRQHGNQYIDVKCRKQGNYKINIQMINKVTKQNTCPTKSSIQIDIQCENMPSYLVFEPIYDGIKTLSTACPLTTKTKVVAYYDKPLTIKVTAYDERRRQFDNFTSLHVDCSISNKELAKFKQDHGKLDHKINENDDSDIAYVEIIPKKIGGNLTLTCRLKSSLIDEQLNIEFVKGIQFDHENDGIKLLHMNDKSVGSRLNILGGSGYFKFEMNEKEKEAYIKLYNEPDNSRQIIMKPVRRGNTQLTVIDQCLPLSQAQLDIHVADLYELKVFGSSRLENNKTSLLYLQVYDSNGNYFDLDDSTFQLMDIHVNQSNPLLSIEYEPKSNLNSYTIAYRLKANECGRTYLQFYSKQQHRRSSQIEFEVFQSLVLEPKSLTLLPLSTYQLSIIGGPQLPGTTVEWSTNDTNIIQIHANNIIEAKHLGYALVKARVVGMDRLAAKSIVYGEDTCYIRVIRVHKIRLHSPTTELLPKMLVPLRIIPLDSDKNPILFCDVLSSLTFTWSLSNTRVAQLRPIIGNVSLSLARTFVMNLETLSSGRLTIDVRLTTTREQLLITKELRDSIDLTITEQFKIGDFGETRTILLSPNSRLSLNYVPNDVELELQTSPIVKLTSTDNSLEANSLTGETILYMKHRNKNSKTKSKSSILGAYLVQVKPIHYMLLQSFLPIETASLLPAVPVDYKLPLTISYHDELGRKFDSASVPLRVWLHRRDMISVSPDPHNTTYDVIPLTDGSSIVEFGSSDSSYDHLRSYLSIQAASGFLMPKSISSTLSKTNVVDSYVVGDIICFESRLSSTTYDGTKVDDEKTTTEDGGKERWSGDDGMIIDRKYGIAQLLIDGERHLHYQIDGQVLTSERFNVHLPKQLRLLTTDNDFIQNGQQNTVKSYFYPVIFGNSQTNVHGLCHRHGLEHAHSKDIFHPQFQCDLEFISIDDESSLTHSQYKASSIFDVRPVFDIDLPGWACEIRPIPPLHHSHHLSTFDNSLSLIVQSKKYSLKSNSITIEFQPFFSVKPSSSMTLSDDHPFSHIHVYTTGKNEKYIQIRSSNPALVHIEKNSTTPFVYNVELRTDERRTNEPVYVHLTNTLTGQEEKLEIKLHRRLTDYPLGRMLSSLFFCIVICSIVYGLANFCNRAKKQQIPLSPTKSPQQSPVPRLFISPPSPNQSQNRLLQQDDILDYGAPSFRSTDSFSPTKQQLPVRLYSAQDLRTRQLQSPRTTSSSFALGNSSSATAATNFDLDFPTRLRRLYDQ
ncbi:unnamed protein product [Didymodactylos carnosus]|uniref:Nuclear pore membrane glycoprotein 210 n=1 Tax=Didymodactylos carnosus TaxID=1234261 RepID=A0A813ZMB9_9BILA|nr:unnamed protein product [Didymodactylos carnosus]CAF0901426.1 unnamed protein product [Didymodactylos carnosus]CAF3529480.1 unnamed protein product [Didymodactylos carnosus]CAF3683794.1 unnamed protein product [Didymodactylos carnosus]